jgi:hypothetical protein
VQLVLLMIKDIDGREDLIQSIQDETSYDNEDTDDTNCRPLFIPSTFTGGALRSCYCITNAARAVVTAMSKLKALHDSVKCFMFIVGLLQILALTSPT